MEISGFDDFFAETVSGCVFSWEKAPAGEYNGLDLLHKKSGVAEPDVERALCLCCGALGGLAVDREIFRNSIVPGSESGFVLKLAGEIPCSDPALRVWRCSLTGYGSHEYCSGKISEISGKIPLPGWLRISCGTMKHDVVLALLKIVERRDSLGSNSGKVGDQTRLVMEASIFCALQ